MISSPLSPAESLAQRIQFEKLLAYISTSLNQLIPKGFDAGIDTALRNLGEFASVDRACIFRINGDGKSADQTHEWCTPAMEHHKDRLQRISTEIFPWWMEKLTLYETICVPCINDLPSEAAVEKQTLRARDVRSCICIPMISGDSLMGFLLMESLQEEDKHLDRLVPMLQIGASIFVHALERAKTAGVLQASEDKFRNLFENVLEGVFQSSPDRKLI